MPARDRSGRLVSGARLTVYANRTTTKATVYSSIDLTTPIANPVAANSSGQFPSIWAPAGTADEPVLYSLAVSGPSGESIGNPAVFNDWQPSLDAQVVSDALNLKADKDLGNVTSPSIARDNLNLPRLNPVDNGADKTGVALSQAAFQAIVTTGRTKGGEIQIPSGTYRLTQFEANYTGLTGEPNNDPTGTPLVGEGIQNTVLMATQAATYAVKITGGLNAAALVYSGLKDLSVAGENPLATPTSRGVHIFSAAYHTMRDVGFYNLGVALKLESVLSSTFDNLKISFGISGIEFLKGAGFSFSNANHFSNLEVRHLSDKGLYGGPCTSLRLTAFQLESIGTQGDDSTGAMKLTFNGDEGHVGLVAHGGYCEDNAGEADIRLENIGSDYVTHVISGVNFNRLSNARCATNCIKSVGKNRIILIACTFTSVGSYTPNASRPYLNGDADTVFIPLGCTFQDSVERGPVRNLEAVSYTHLTLPTKRIV